MPRKIDDYTDLDFLAAEHLDDLTDKIDTLTLTDEQKENRTRDLESAMEAKLKKLNQEMHDVHSISTGHRVQMICGMIMAGLGVKDKVSPLALAELKGDSGQKTHDGQTILNRIESFLAEKNLPQEKREMIGEVLRTVFIHAKLHQPNNNGESVLKRVYAQVLSDVLPYLKSKYHIDFTGRLFNVLNDWVDVPDGAKNDVVLTPRYVCELMSRLCRVDRNSYVWDYATGSAGFLISAMKLMIEDAKTNIKNPQEQNERICRIKAEQLLGVEKLPDIYMLAVLNMILMGDGSSKGAKQFLSEKFRNRANFSERIYFNICTFPCLVSVRLFSRQPCSPFWAGVFGVLAGARQPLG